MEKSQTVITVQTDQGSIALAAFALACIDSDEVFADRTAIAGPLLAGQGSLVRLCHDRWIDLADALGALPVPAEVLWAHVSALPTNGSSGRITLLACVVGRASTTDRAVVGCRQSARDVEALLRTFLDYAEFRPVDDCDKLQAFVDTMLGGSVVEIRRRYRLLVAGHGQFESRPLGFVLDTSQRGVSGEEIPGVPHLFPWVASDDSWLRLVEALVAVPGSCFVVHLKGLASAPESARDRARAALAQSERHCSDDGAHGVRTVLKSQANALRAASLLRVATLEGRLVAARCFMAAPGSVPGALAATVISSVDDASANWHQAGAELLFRGGADVGAVACSEVLSPLDEAPIENLFGPSEAAAVFRTVMPTRFALPGIDIRRARTAPVTGRSGTDVRVGKNSTGRGPVDVKLDERVRFRHSYVVGQTGTGKSTLLLNMIADDIERGRGVAVIDPHGPLIDRVIEHIPRERITDVVLLDLADMDRPVGFNVLRVSETDAVRYRFARDLVIDDLLGYLHRAYDPQMMGPIFETQFRAMLALLLGQEPPEPPFVPSLHVLPLLYSNRQLRDRLIERSRGVDPVTEMIIDEALKVRGDGAIDNLAPYVTNKFSRFIADRALRNVTCQQSTLDFDRIIGHRQILLVHLARGRIGDHAAGLIASQLVSRLRLAVMKRAINAGHPPFYLYADEFQLVADARFVEMLAEARKFGLALTLAHQYTKQVPDAVLQGILGNVGTTIVMRVGSNDAQFLEPFFAPTFTHRDLSSLGDHQAYVRSFGELGSAPFSVDLAPPRPDPDLNLAEEVRNCSRTRYGRPREEVEHEILGTTELYGRADIPDRTS